MKKLLICLLVCALITPVASARIISYTQEELDAFRGKQAWIYCDEGLSPAHGLMIEYDRPWALYLNGTPVTIRIARNGDGPYGGHAEVEIGTVGEGGAIINMPIMYLSFEEIPAVQASVFKGDPLYGDTHMASKQLLYVEADTELTVYGKYDSEYGGWAHVKAGDQLGYIFFEDLVLEDETARVLRVNEPKAYTMMTQKKNAAYIHLNDENRRLIEERGGYDKLTLEDKAALSQLELALGEDYLYVVNLLPGEGDIPMEEAVELAKKAFISVCEVDETFLADFEQRYSFFENPGQEPGVKKWVVEFLDNGQRSGMYRYFMVKMIGSTGEIVETSSREAVFPMQQEWAEFTDEEYIEPESGFDQRWNEFIAKYGPEWDWGIEVWAALGTPYDTLPIEGEITQEAALQKAFDYILAEVEVPEGEFDDYFVRYHFSDMEGQRFWDVIIYPGKNPDKGGNLYYSVRMDSVTGDLLETIVLPGTSNG